MHSYDALDDDFERFALPVPRGGNTRRAAASKAELRRQQRSRDVQRIRRNTKLAVCVALVLMCVAIGVALPVSLGVRRNVVAAEAARHRPSSRRRCAAPQLWWRRRYRCWQTRSVSTRV